MENHSFLICLDLCHIGPRFEYSLSVIEADSGTTALLTVRGVLYIDSIYYQSLLYEPMAVYTGGLIKKDSDDTRRSLACFLFNCDREAK